MKIFIWTTSLQADSLAMAISLDRDPEVELLIVAAELEACRHEPIARVRMLECRLLSRADEGQEAAVRAFDADVFLADNHIAKFLAGRKMVMHCHGVPPKIRPRRFIRSFHKRSSRLIGKVTKPNERFIVQCDGETDYRHRVAHWCIAAENCRIWGSAYSDLLLEPPNTRAELEDINDLDVGGRKNIPLSLTWNFRANAFHVLGDDDRILGVILKTASEFDAILIFSMHDKFRNAPELIERVEARARRYPRSVVKYKNEYADNLDALVVCDVMICNFSSFIVFHYFTGKPSIHISQVDLRKWFVDSPRMHGGGASSVIRRDNNRLWIYPFEDNGGCLPREKVELVADLTRSLEDDSYCRDRAQAFIVGRIFQADGQGCAGIVADLKRWVDRS